MHGHAVVFGAPVMTGATRLAAESCARIGAGLTTVIAPEGTGQIYRETLAAHVIVRDREEGLDFLSDERINAILIGPGAGNDCSAIRNDIQTILKLNRKTVIDADGLNAIDFSALNNNCIITPHEGEFKKLFPEMTGDKTEKAQKAARLFGGVVVYKGPETIIASLEHCAVNENAPPDLATAGTGDVLSGMITGLLAQGMEPFKAACAAVWIHGAAATRFGHGLVASDLPGLIPEILRELT